MLNASDITFKQGEMELEHPDGTKNKVAIMVMTVEVFGNGGKIDFIMPLEPTAKLLAERTMEFHMEATKGLAVVRGADANAIINNTPQNGETPR
jgi:hypothetical protein